MSKGKGFLERKRRVAFWIAAISTIVAIFAGKAWNRAHFDPEEQLVWIEPGSFSMGGGESETGAVGDTSPFPVTLSKGYYLGKYEITQPIYKAIMDRNPAYFSGLRAVRYQPLSLISGRGLPVEKVSWNDAMEFCRRLTEREREAGRLPDGYVYTLPTEAQWEYACRAGSETAYCFGDAETDLHDYGWYDENSGDKTNPVGRKRPNKWGLHDMHGNVWEWCRDWYAKYPEEPVTDPGGPASGNTRVNRGGGWYGNADNSKSAYRNMDTPDYRKAGLGFRVACVRQGGSEAQSSVRGAQVHPHERSAQR